MLYDGDTFEHNGRTYRLELTPDDMGPPWKWSDGHGIVSEHKHHAFGQGSKPAKAPGERILYWDRGYYRTYDFQETMKIAKRDGWGLNPDDEAKLAQALGRAPTRKEIIVQAVERDFEYLRAWCNDEWSWVCLGVHHDESGESEYLGGMASNDEFIAEEARNLADEIAYRLDEALAREITESRPDMAPAYEASK